MTGANPPGAGILDRSRIRLGRARRTVGAAGPQLAGAGRMLSPGAASAALTFDDGPDPVWTALVLDLLGELGVPATFFLVGQRARAHPDIVRRMLDEGHGIGSHSASHPDPAAMPVRELVDDYRRGRWMVESVAGVEVRLFRPPTGRIDLAHAPAIRASGLRPWLWSLDTEDWREGTTTEQILASVSPGDGDVVLLHDGLQPAGSPEAHSRAATVAAVPVLVERYRRAGLSLVLLPDASSAPARPRAGVLQ
ncbi:MAG TPA: polysaccharide deacetylase family protein [Acidimicrobiales bacterium]|nr:polysaccharide deacetylase family protein [Acidimicrobiales bacterium]